MKATKHTFNKLIKSNNLFIKVKSSFNGMIDGVEFYNDGFTKAEPTTHCVKNTYGIDGAWLVNGGRDYFTHYETDTMVGLEVYNACGSFILATKK